MCRSCGGICGAPDPRRRRKTTVDVKVNGRIVFVRDGRLKTFDRMPIVLRRSVRDRVMIGGRLERTREGFLLCRDVPLARTGDQIYSTYELPGVPALNGRIVAQRDAEHVFDQQAIQSFAGKAFTDDHPDDDVTGDNFRLHMVGVVQNPRRGTGRMINHMIGDIMVFDPKVAKDIEAGRKTEVSAGYDCDYEIVAPGRAKQVNIRGNHVSLVDEGRCGPTCAIFSSL